MASDATQFAPEDAPSRDGGFTLVEVIWALFLLGLIAMASLGLFVNGMKSVAHVQRQQAAVSLANSSMDLARSVSGGSVDATGTSGLVKGRSDTDVKATWNAAKAANASDTSDMTIVWDPELGLVTADQWVPVTTTAVVDNQTYTINTLVGTCYRLAAASTASQNCVATNPDPTGTTYVQMFRVRVIVNWDESADGTRHFTYRVSSLVDPSTDATWNTDIKPFAYDDEVSVDAASSTFIAIVSNDSVNYDTTGSVSPVKTLTQPSTGSVAVNTALGLNGVVFTAPANSSGTVTFTYYVQGSDGAISAAPATVTVHILPVPVTDTILVGTGSTTVINTNLLANDIGATNISGSRKTTIVPVWSTSTDMFNLAPTPAITAARNADQASLASAGITVAANGTVTFNAPNTVKTTTFYYYLVDDPTSGSGARYPSNVAVKVTITTETTPTTSPLTASYTVPANSTYVSDVIDWMTPTGNAAGTKIKITGVTFNGTAGTYDTNVFLDGAKYTSASGNTGTTLSFLKNNASMGTYVISYKTVASGGTQSATTGTITVTVLPLAVNYTFTKVTTSGTTIDLTTAGIAPTGGVQITALAATTTACTVTNTAGTTKVVVTYTGSYSPSNLCKFQYKIQSTTITPQLTSSFTGTITVSKT